MIRKGILALFLMASFTASGAIIDVSLQTDSEYLLRPSDSVAGTFSSTSVAFTPEAFALEINLDEGKALPQIVDSVDVVDFIQHSAITEFANPDFSLFSPFETVFRSFFNDDFGADPANIFEQSSSMDLSVFYNETSDPYFVGGGVSLRFNKVFTYNYGDFFGGAGEQELVWLSGRIFLRQISSLDEFNAVKDLQLSDLLPLFDGAYATLNTNYDSYERNWCFSDPSCIQVDRSTNYYGFSSGTASLRSASPVPEPSALVFLGLGVLLIRRKRC